MGETPEVNREIYLLREDTAVVRECLHWNRLHVAASRGQLELFKELLDKNPELAEALDSQQRSLLHLASANGHVEIVKEITKTRPQMCLARDRNGANPLHVAAMGGKRQVLNALFQANPHGHHAVRDKVDRGDTILHLCIKYNQFECLKLLLEKFECEELVNAKDGAGNTILHLAVSELAVADKRKEIIDCILEAKIEVNATNASKQTAMDILLLRQGPKQEESDNEIKVSLQKHDAKRVRQLLDPECLKEQRNALLVVAVLLTTIAFQAGVTPPGGVWPSDDQEGHRGGEAMMSYKNPILYQWFLSFNAMAFFASVSMILLLISGLPFKRRRYLWTFVGVLSITMITMAVTFTLMIALVTPNRDRKSVGLIVGVGVGFCCSVIASFFLVLKAISKKRERKPRGNGAISPVVDDMESELCSLERTPNTGTEI